MKKQSFSTEFGDHHIIIDDFTRKESWRSEVANTLIDEEPQTEIVGSIQDETHFVAELGDRFSLSLSTILDCPQEGL